MAQKCHDLMSPLLNGIKLKWTIAKVGKDVSEMDHSFMVQTLHFSLGFAPCLAFFICHYSQCSATALDLESLRYSLANQFTAAPQKAIRALFSSPLPTNMLSLPQMAGGSGLAVLQCSRGCEHCDSSTTHMK